MSDPVIKKIRKLLRLASGKGTTPAEAASAAAKAQELMDRHRISEAQLGVDPGEIVMQKVYTGRRLQVWRKMLFSTLAGYNGCTAMLGHHGMYRSVLLAGRPQDIEAVRHLARYLACELDRLCIEVMRALPPRPHPQRFRNGFKVGAVLTIDTRLELAREEARARLRAEGSAATLAIAKVDHRVAEVEEWERQQGIEAKPQDVADELGNADRAAARVGAVAGFRIGLTPSSRQLA